PTDSSAGGGAHAKAKKSPLLLIAVALFALLGGGGAGWYFLGHKSDAHSAQEPKHGAAPIFVTLEPFVVNLAGDTQHYLQVGIDLRVVDPHLPDQIKAHLPEVRNAVLLLLSSKSADQLSSVEHKNQLRYEIREAVNKPLGIDTPASRPVAADKAEGAGEAHAAELPKSGPSKNAKANAEDAEAGVVDVLLTSFVIQ